MLVSEPNPTSLRPLQFCASEAYWLKNRKYLRTYFGLMGVEVIFILAPSY